jgi:hypothetical protein
LELGKLVEVVWLVLLVWSVGVMANEKKKGKGLEELFIKYLYTSRYCNASTLHFKAPPHPTSWAQVRCNRRADV